MDRENLWRHFASRTFSENGIIFVRVPGFLGFIVKTSSDDGVGHSWQGFFFFFRNNTSLDFRRHIFVFWDQNPSKSRKRGVYKIPRCKPPLVFTEIWISRNC